LPNRLSALGVSILFLCTGIFKGFTLANSLGICFLLWSCHLAGGPQSGAYAELWQNPGLEQNPKGQKTEYEQNAFHGNSFLLKNIL
jgi:hypothetical protein